MFELVLNFILWSIYLTVFLSVTTMVGAVLISIIERFVYKR
jgi:hypothetical protein